LQIVTTGESQ
jgi:hypothetical protein